MFISSRAKQFLPLVVSSAKAQELLRWKRDDGGMFIGLEIEFEFNLLYEFIPRLQLVEKGVMAINLPLEQCVQPRAIHPSWPLIYS